ncbi:class I SAM-dependent methyltransferase [candidate division WS5 bacterium]|uniref:Class I SAM-dependent methyltransferase n=1 Tax=candidate division WS5 bacterium TaxID=2093353 RepID=A0A419DBK7_9BACT|nr:MAG: class I SAM-dependent methyltransferase [candidate division WS5 bacterium]
MKKNLEKIYHKATQQNQRNILDLLEKGDKGTRFLDLGCDEGSLTLQLASQVKTKEIYGVEIVDERIAQAEKRGVKVKKFDLNSKFDYENEYFDAIHANQVIEHLYNSDNFLSEIYRTLKKGGYAIISTENASSWCNVFASIMGWQIFSLTNFSNKKKGIGNPLAIHAGDDPKLTSWSHIRIYNFQGLKEYFEVFGFNIEDIKGSGYFPLSYRLGNIDKRHCHFMTFKIRK